MAFLIPRAPLESGTYEASVTFSYGKTKTPVSFSFTVGDQLAGDPADGGADPAPGDGEVPKPSAHPAKRSSDRSPSFAFAQTGATGFECKLDKAKWRACASPITYRHVAKGRHRFRVRATGTTRTAPASFRFRTL